MRLTNFINESNEYGLGITFVDLDETLFKTFARIRVMTKDGNVIQSLTNAEFNQYELKDGEYFDFGEFRSSKIFHDTSIPIEPMLKRITGLLKRAEKKGSKVVILTARADLDNKDLFLERFRKEGFPIDKVYVERAGNRHGPSIPLIKKKIVTDYLSTGKYRRVRIFDDYMENCKEFLNIDKDIPQQILNKVREVNDIGDDVPDEQLITFTAYLVDDNGNVKEIK